VVPAEPVVSEETLASVAVLRLLASAVLVATAETLVAVAAVAMAQMARVVQTFRCSIAQVQQVVQEAPLVSRASVAAVLLMARMA
jgi:hypothetical protein